MLLNIMVKLIQFLISIQSKGKIMFRNDCVSTEYIEINDFELSKMLENKSIVIVFTVEHMKTFLILQIKFTSSENSNQFFISFSTIEKMNDHRIVEFCR